jgi:hypothetical protein
MVYVDDVDLLGDNIDTTKKTQTLIDNSKAFDLEINAEKSKYMLLSRHQDTGKNYSIKTGTRAFENVADVKYLETTVTNQNLIQGTLR